VNNEDQESEIWRGPLIFIVPAYGFVMALYLECLGQSKRAVSAKTRRWNFPKVRSKTAKDFAVKLTNEGKELAERQTEFVSP